MLKPRIEIIVWTHGDEEADLLRRENIGEGFMSEHELAVAMSRLVVAGMPAAADASSGEVQN